MSRAPTCLCGECLKCRTRVKLAKLRAAKPEHFRQYQRAWYEANLDHARAVARKDYVRNRKAILERRRRYCEEHPEKEMARQRAGYARRSGRLAPDPCEQCGDPKVEGHHDDYSQPLSVRWLCKRCHSHLHRSEAAA